MNREELLTNICPYPIYCADTDCMSCKEILNSWLDEYDKQIRAEVVDEFLKKDKECQQSSEDCPYANSEKGCIECIAERVKEQKC